MVGMTLIIQPKSAVRSHAVGFKPAPLLPFCHVIDRGLVGGSGGSSGRVRVYSCGVSGAGNGAIGGVNSGVDSEVVNRYAGDKPSSRSFSSLNFQLKSLSKFSIYYLVKLAIVVKTID